MSRPGRPCSRLPDAYGPFLFRLYMFALFVVRLGLNYINKVVSTCFLSPLGISTY